MPNQLLPPNPASWQTRLARLGHAALDLLFPPACALCGREVGHAAEFAPTLCTDCQTAAAPAIPYACRRCAAPVGPYLDTANGCIHCRKDRFAFDAVVRLGVYDGLLRTLCLKGKQAGAEPLLAAAGDLLCRREQTTFDRHSPEMIVPVPLHWTQRLIRPHNPAAVLGRVLARRLRASFQPHILSKARRTPAQARLSPSQRRANLRNAFRVRGASALAGRRVLLVDDILTTGSTAHECARTLRAAGAGPVVVAVLARGVGA